VVCWSLAGFSLHDAGLQSAVQGPLADMRGRSDDSFDPLADNSCSASRKLLRTDDKIAGPFPPATAQAYERLVMPFRRVRLPQG
jgi:hypothetical protein